MIYILLVTCGPLARPFPYPKQSFGSLFDRATPSLKHCGTFPLKENRDCDLLAPQYAPRQPPVWCRVQNRLDKERQTSTLHTMTYLIASECGLGLGSLVSQHQQVHLRTDQNAVFHVDQQTTEECRD